MKPTDKARSWKAGTALGRIEACRFMLKVHGFLSEAEDAKVKARVDKWVDRHAAPQTGKET